ncbi:MAG: PIG-L family deacetylase [Lentisphaerae bacterium]|nr:PIG-L family deacetylase [Lentisphaerota bacterium]
MRTYDITSTVEDFILEHSSRELKYSSAEKIGVIEVPDFPTLGRVVALRFVEWLQRNPEGVISLPTGKTPEHFIFWTQRLLETWNQSDTQELLGKHGLDTAHRPRMESYVFVQIDEFFPLNPEQENSFAHYIRRFYMETFGLDPKKALLMDAWKRGAPAGKNLGEIFPDGFVDMTLRYRAPQSDIERAQAAAIEETDQAMLEYEARVRQCGGIGFFLGGIGPDGHIGFNIRGSDHFSTTRLAPINYETAAAAATDLGGIESSRRKAILTIGLRTLTWNPTATIVIMAAGESKAQVVRDAIEMSPSVSYPGTVLQSCQGARFYLTRGAISKLSARRKRDWAVGKELSAIVAERLMIDLACRRRKPLVALMPADREGDELSMLLPAAVKQFSELVSRTDGAIRERIDRATMPLRESVFVHTGPHHDDIMLGYLPYIVHLVREPSNRHHFVTFTSGFTSVTNRYLFDQLENLTAHLKNGLLDALIAEDYFAPGDINGKNRDVFQYLDGVAARSKEMDDEGEARRMYRNLAEICGTTDMDAINLEISALRSYLATRYPGQKDIPKVQKLKGMIREWEEELVWAHLGFSCEQVRHLRLGFYTGDLFTPQPTIDRDVKPIRDLFEQLKPNIVTVALDPEGAGPDTHYKVLQATAEALRGYVDAHPDRALLVWGYRNIWHRFHPAEANLYVPVSLNSLAIMQSTFNLCFGSQRNASFPSYEHDGPFSDLAQQIWAEQYETMKICLGREFFQSHSVARIRAARGMNYLKQMTPEEFFREARKLRQATESREAV